MSSRYYPRLVPSVLDLGPRARPRPRVGCASFLAARFGAAGDRSVRRVRPVLTTRPSSAGAKEAGRG